MFERLFISWRHRTTSGPCGEPRFGSRLNTQPSSTRFRPKRSSRTHIYQRWIGRQYYYNHAENIVGMHSRSAKAPAPFITVASSKYIMFLVVLEKETDAARLPRVDFIHIDLRVCVCSITTATLGRQASLFCLFILDLYKRTLTHYKPLRKAPRPITYLTS
jgi:hypothetical protein